MMFGWRDSLIDIKKSLSDGMILISVIMTIILLIRYYLMNSLTMIVVMVAIHSLIIIALYIGKSSRCYLLYIGAGLGWIILGNMNVYNGLNLWKLVYYCMAIVVMLVGFLATYLQIKMKESLAWPSWRLLFIFIALVVMFGGTWGLKTANAIRNVNRASPSVWGVPNLFDDQICEEEGRVIKISYETKAYGTDNRKVEKSCNVYLPYGYDEAKQYNILYLLHGTGDDEDYWMVQNINNKTMIDNLIYHGEVEPMIIVTPSWYVEDDCNENLDLLTYSFALELRNDLMPYIESQYATYAENVTDIAFENSREHRAFAGLSRGSATMFHSAIQQNLDAFAWFGGFSASRVTEEEWKSTAMSENLGEYTFSYLYMTTGTSDFTAERQFKDYRMLLNLDSRFIEGVNISFDVFPMRYHSQGSWHLALYNYLQKIF